MLAKGHVKWLVACLGGVEFREGLVWDGEGVGEWRIIGETKRGEEGENKELSGEAHISCY